MVDQYPEATIRLFSESVKRSGIGRLEQEPGDDPSLQGKRLGVLNAATWISLWCDYFGRQYLPGVKLVHAGNDAVQLNFTQAFVAGEPCPPQVNIDAFACMARNLVDLGGVDAILITCSTMNRSYEAVDQAVGVPVVQIDAPMMEAAVNHGGKVLVVASLVTTVNSTQSLLEETAQRLGKAVQSTGVTVEEAWHRLAEGNIEEHNRLLAQAIRKAQSQEPLGCAVLAQLSMAVFSLSYPDPLSEFGIPVFTSGQAGFQYMREVLSTL